MSTAPPVTLDEIYRYIISEIGGGPPTDSTLRNVLLALGAAIQSGQANTGVVNGVAEFGIDNTGTVADNSTIINNALQTLAPSGYDLFIPPQSDGAPAIVLLQNPIEIGNGSLSGPSTYPGNGIVGSGFPGASKVVASSAVAG